MPRSRSRGPLLVLAASCALAAAPHGPPGAGRPDPFLRAAHPAPDPPAASAPGRVVLPGLGVDGGSAPPAVVEREAWLMGTRLRVRVAARTRGEAVAASELAFAEVRRLESLLSTWRPDTDLSRLNSAPPGREVRVELELAALLDEAAVLSARTGGAFDPGVGALIDAWDLRGAGRRPAEPELRSALAATGIRQFGFGPGGAAVRRSEAAWLDSGGFGKGAALRSAGAVLRRVGVRSAFLDFGGQVLAIGAPILGGATEDAARGSGAGGSRAGGTEWEVAVADPARRGRPLAWLRLRDLSAATSAASERFVEVSGERLGHVVDPRDGRPVPAWGSVTVVDRDPLVADALSTGLFVLGPTAGLKWALAHDSVAALFLAAGAEGVSGAWTPDMEALLVSPPAGTRRPDAP